MQLSFSSAAVPELSLAEAMSLAARVGYPALEVQCWPRGASRQATHVDVAEFNAHSARRIRELTGRQRVVLSGLACMRACHRSLHDDARIPPEHWRALVDAAAALELPYVALDAGSVVEIVELVKYATRRSIALYLEAEQFGDSRRSTSDGKPDETLGGLHPLGGSVPGASTMVSLVPYHLVQRGLDEVETAALLGANVGRVGAADEWAYFGPSVGAQGDSGDSSSPRVRWVDCLSELARAGFRGPVVVGLSATMQASGLEARIGALRAAQAYLGPSLAQICHDAS